ncbi:hypothetical protein CH372_17285 [Leptospira meyeri]|uniref:hypothetical protein n=1 Tax=Leptospira meyeri TaxID=29508 RepID=UPI000C2B0DEF|nr:hypothetical protein [Leptospira meyeri]PKA10836.1 hypothetical protein CH372_17285 [Leptospira meyeri]PKA23956.1 hypothetical protein CH381_23145 [Leptospira sp. mixed culture ATI2-C-A1]
MNNSETKLFVESIKKELKDNLADGFHHIQTGRAGYIYYIENEFVVPIMTEMSGSNEYNLLVSGELEYLSEKFDLKHSTSEIILTKERKRIQKLLIDWLSKQKIRHDLHSEEWRPDIDWRS